MSFDLETDLNVVPESRPFEPDYPGQRNPWDRAKHPTNYWYIQSIIDKVDNELVRPPKYSEETKLEVYKLRDMGYTLREIASTVGCSKSTACLYIQKREIETKKIKIKQPGTNKVVETQYSINEVNIGKIRPSLSKNDSND